MLKLGCRSDESIHRGAIPKELDTGTAQVRIEKFIDGARGVFEELRYFDLDTSHKTLGCTRLTPRLVVLRENGADTLDTTAKTLPIAGEQ